jgi:hypothetical protein
MSDEIKKDEELELNQEQVVEEPIGGEVTDEQAPENPVGETDKTDEVLEGADNGEKTDDTQEEKVEGEVVEETPVEEDVPSEEVPTDTPVEAVDEEHAKMKAEIEEMRHEKEMRESIDNFHKIEEDLIREADEARAAMEQALQAAAQKFDIPTDCSLEELAAKDPKKAQLAQELLQKSQAVLQQKAYELTQKREQEAAKIVFKKAEKLFKAYELDTEQAEAAAQTFITIISNTGVNDLDEDLKAKVKLSVAQAMMDKPKAIVDVPPVVEADTIVSNEPSEKIEEEPDVQKEEKIVVTPQPAIDELMESATENLNSAHVDSITEDNVLERLNSTPFRERTAFYAENKELIERALRNKRG